MLNTALYFLNQLCGVRIRIETFFGVKKIAFTWTEFSLLFQWICSVIQCISVLSTSINVSLVVKLLSGIPDCTDGKARYFCVILPDSMLDVFSIQVSHPPQDANN